MLRLPSLLQAGLLVVAAAVSSVHGLGLQDASATELQQDSRDDSPAIQDPVSLGAEVQEVLGGSGRDLQAWSYYDHILHPKVYYPPKYPKKKEYYPPKNPKKKDYYPKYPKKKSGAIASASASASATAIGGSAAASAKAAAAAFGGGAAIASAKADAVAAAY